MLLDLTEGSFQPKSPNPCHSKSEKILENFFKAKPH